MKILYFMPRCNGEYEGVLLYHGLCQLENVEVYIDNNLPWIYSDYDGDYDSLYGKGFNYAGLVNPEKRIIHSRKDIIRNIKQHFYDVIIYGAIYRYKPLLGKVLSHYKKREIVFIDGADEDYGLRKNYVSFGGLLTHMLPIWYFPISMMRNALILRNKGLYFKREISPFFAKKFIPIQFAIPKEKIIDESKAVVKKNITAIIIPGKSETYIYDDMESYNKGYEESWFGITMKKAGWDCMRHYEILANGCIPYFLNIKKCPKDTMFIFPKQILMHTNKLYERVSAKGYFTKAEKKVYNFYQNLLLRYTRENLTTEALAKYVLAFVEWG